MSEYRGTAPKPHRCALNPGGPDVKAVYQVIDHSDGEHVVDTFRNRALADRLATVSPAYEVREISLVYRS